MKKYLKHLRVLALVLLVVPIAVVMTACGSIGKKLTSEEAIAALASASYDYTSWSGAEMTLSGKVTMSFGKESASAKMKVNMKMKFLEDEKVELLANINSSMSGKVSGAKVSMSTKQSIYAIDDFMYVTEGKTKSKMALDSGLMELLEMPFMFGDIDEMFGEYVCPFCDGEGCEFCEDDEDFSPSISKAGKKDIKDGYAITIVMTQDKLNITMVFSFNNNDEFTGIKVTGKGEFSDPDETDGMSVNISNMEMELKQFNGKIDAPKDLDKYTLSEGDLGLDDLFFF